MTTENLSALPEGWLWTDLGEVSDLTSGNPAPQGAEYFRGGIYPFVRVQDMGKLGDSVYIKDTTDHINDKAIQKMRLFPKGAVLFTKSGMSILLNQRAILGKDMYVVSHIGICEPLGDIPSEWLYYWLKTIDFKSLSHATTLPSLRLSKVRDVPVPLPPLLQQHRTIAKIEELLTQLNAGIEALQRIKSQLKRYRQAVLKHAFEGKLTKEWREAHKGELEPAAVLLERIKEARWKNTNGKHKELPPVDTMDLPDPPNGWGWTRVGEITAMMQYGTSEKAHKDTSGIPVLRMGNIHDGKLTFQDPKYFPRDWPQLNSFILQSGDVLFNRTNSAELVGKTAVYKEFHPRAVFASYLIRLRLSKGAYIPDMLSFFINSFYGRKYIASVVSQQVGQANVNGTKLSLMPIPLPPIAEQSRIVEEIERCFSVADEVEKVVEQSLRQSERLQQSILKQAFEGNLVPQDENDESAEKLLERIRQEKGKQKENEKAAKSKNPRQLRTV